MEISIDYFVSILEEADTFTMRSINLSLSQIDNFLILEKLRSVESGLSTQYQRRAILDNKQFFKFELNISQFLANESSLIVEIIKIKLSFF